MKFISSSRSRVVSDSFQLNSSLYIANRRFRFWERFSSAVLILTFLVTFAVPFSEFSSLGAQSTPQLNSTRAFSGADLQPYVDSARLQTDQSSFMNILNGGEQTVEAAWEAQVNAEIDAIVNSVTASDAVNDVSVYQQAVRAQLELQKQQAKSQWLADAAAFVQTELQSFLNVLSQNTSNNVTSSNTTAVNTVDPTVQSTTAAPATQEVSPAQAAQSYYQGVQAWDTKWQNLLAQQSAWEQNSLNGIQDGILQWNTAISGLENDKLAYLNGIEQTKTQWLANKQLIQDAQNGVRTGLHNTILSIRAQENLLKSSASSDPSLNAVFEEMDSLLDTLQNALDSNASLGTLAEALGTFFQNQISNASAKADYWNIQKWQETYATQTFDFSKEVGTANLSCDHTSGSGSNWCFGQPAGSQAVTYGVDGNVYGWAATSGGFQSVLVSNPAVSNNSSASRSEGHNQVVCNGLDAGGVCWGGHGAYTNGGVLCSEAGVLVCNSYDLSWVVDNTYSLSVAESFNQQQIANNNAIRNAILGNFNVDFAQSSQAGNALGGSTPIALETKVYLGGSALTSSNWYSALGTNNQVQIQTKYKYIDSAMQANQNFWANLSSQFTNISTTFLSLVNPLKDWEARSAQYETEYEAKLVELEQTKQSTIQNYDQQIAQMKAARGNWVTDVYGFQIAGIEGSADNASSQFRSGQETWADTISIFQQAELNWYLAAKDSMSSAISGSNGEAQFQSNAIVLAGQLQNQITSSETNTTNLYNAANSLVDSYQYSAAGNLIQQALVNQQNQTTWNQQGANLSQSIADSFGRSEAYKTAELNASNRINALAQTIYGNGAYIVDNIEINSIANQASGYSQNQTFWQDEINGTNGGFNFNGRTNLSQTKITQFTEFRDDIALATTLQTEVVDEERDFLKQAGEYFEKSERFQELSEKAKSEGKFDESSYYMTAALREKNNALGFLKKKYHTLGDEITDSVSERGLNHTRESFLNYRDSLLNKNFQSSAQLTKQIQDGKNTVEGILSEGASYNQIQGMLQTAQSLNQQGSESREKIEKLLEESQELANRDISGGLLDGLQEMIAAIQGNLPQTISSNAVTQAILAQEKELAEKQEKANELLSHMNSLVTNNNDLAALQTLLQGGGQAMNLAANSAVSKYLDDYSKKLQKDNEERSANLQKTLLDALQNGESYKYLRDSGYEFRVDGDGISAYRQIYSGEIVIDGNAMTKGSYSPELEYQYIRIQTKFNPGNLSVDMLDPNGSFNAQAVANLKAYIDDLQKNVETMFAQFSDKTQEVKGEYTQNQEIQTEQEKQYAENRDSILSMFQGLEPNFKQTFQPTMTGLKDYHQEASKYSFEEGTISARGNVFQRLSGEMFGGILTGNGAYTGSRELKGTVNIKGIPVEISYGSQDLIVVSGFQIENLGYNFKLKGTGTKYAGQELSNVNNKYSQYQEDIEARIAAKAKANDAEKESKGFIFTILNGMNGGSGSMGQRFTQAVRSEAQSRITGAVAEATGLPASFVGALVGGGSMKDAVKAFEKATINSAISKATGLPEWLISSQMDKMNKPKEQWYQSQTFQMVTTVAAVAAAPFTGGASLAIAMAVNAGLGAATGAASGGLKGALVGAVGGAAGAAVRSFTGGAVTVGLSYSAENGFGASVGVGYGPATVSVGISERGGTTVDLGLTKGGFNAGLSYNSKTGSTSVNAGFTSKSGTGLALSYNEGDGFGASLSKSFSNGVNAGLSWSEKAGVGGSIGYEAPGDKDKPKDSLANKMQGAGGSLSWNQRDGVSASVTASGGVTAGSWSQSGGFQANTNFLNDKWKADFVSGKAKEDADAQAASRGAQNKNNAESGAAAIAAAGVETQRREDGILDHILNKASDALDGGLNWVGNKIDGAIDSVVGAASSAWDGVKGVASAAWDGVKNAFGPDKVVMMPIGAGYAENPADRHLRVGEDAISSYLDKQRSENPYLRKGVIEGVKFNEVDVSMDPKYHKKLINMELESGVSGGNLILNKESGKLYYRTEATGADSKLIPTNPNERVTSPWTKVEMHTDNLNGIMSGDYHAAKASAQSVWGPDGGTFKITDITKMKLGGNEITTRTVINGKEIIEHHRHVMNQMPDVAYNAFQKGTPLPYGTPIAYTGITGNMAVSIDNDKNSPRFGMLSAPAYHKHTKVDNAETHRGFIKGVTFGPEVRQSQGLPAFDYTSYYKGKVIDLLTGGKK